MSTEQLTNVITIINSYAWGMPSIMLLVGTGLYLTFRLHGIQFRSFFQGLSLLFGAKPKESAPGEISRFEALSTALSATIGTGNIAGVATAITMGGPGAVFWMWVTALVGMATKFASCTLAVKYREIDADGKYAGGPMFTLKHGLKMPRLGATYAILTLLASFGIGNMVQANSIIGGLGFVIPEISHYKLIVGLSLAVLVGVVTLGGVTRIARVASFVVPFMAVIYTLVALIILVLHYQEIPSAFTTIFNLALNPAAAGGGAVGSAIQYGVARGVFSNESGLGSAAIAHAAARTNDPVKQGLVAMIGPFIDTIVICSMTALVIIIIGNGAGMNGAALTAYSFEHGVARLGATAGHMGAAVVSFGLVFFAYTTMIAWSYYGDRCADYLFGAKAVKPYRVIFLIFIIVGATLPLNLVWQLSDIANIFMAVPNLICVILMAGALKKLCDNYFAYGSSDKSFRPPAN